MIIIFIITIMICQRFQDSSHQGRQQERQICSVWLLTAELLILHIPANESKFKFSQQMNLASNCRDRDLSFQSFSWKLTQIKTKPWPHSGQQNILLQVKFIKRKVKPMICYHSYLSLTKWWQACVHWTEILGHQLAPSRSGLGFLTSQDTPLQKSTCVWWSTMRGYWKTDYYVNWADLKQIERFLCTLKSGRRAIW